MPLLRKQPFVKNRPPKALGPDDEVFYFEQTGEIFTDYEQFFERVILCNSLVWSCEVTGKSGLTYDEAKESENKAKKSIAFPPYLQKPLLFLTTLTHRTRLIDLNEDIYLFAKERYFINELVEVITPDDERKQGKVIKVIAPNKQKENGTKSPKKPLANGTITISDSDSDVICLDDDDVTADSSKTESPKKSPQAASKKDEGFGIVAESPTGLLAGEYEYVVQENKGNNIYIIKASHVHRKKALVTRDRCKLYFKQHCDSFGNGVWKLKERYANKWKIDNMKFEDIFVGPPPVFPKSEVKRIKKGPEATKRKKQDVKRARISSEMTEEDSIIAEAKRELKERKKQEKADKKAKQLEMEREMLRMREENDRLMRMTVEEVAAEKERQRLQRLAEKEKKKEELREQWLEEKQRRKEERDKEREKKRQEKKEQEMYLKEWKKTRDDLECDDLKPLPAPTPILTHLPTELFGDAVMVLEFLSGFGEILQVENENPNVLSLESIVRCLQDTDSTGVYCDLLKLLLTAIFHLQEEEEEEEHEENEELDENNCPSSTEHGDISSYNELVNQADKASQWPQQAFSTPLRELPLDGFSISEVLRLHFMSSGARSSLANAKFQYQQRGGYTCQDDAGLEFRLNEPAIIKELAERNVFDLSPGDKLKILSALIRQCLTYVLCRDLIEDNQDKLKSVKSDLRHIQWAEERRRKDESAFWWKKKCEERAKERELEAQRKEQKKREKEELLRQDEVKADVDTIVDSQKTEASVDSLTSVKPVEKPSPPNPERKSSRLKDAKTTKESKDTKEEEDIDLLNENIDWENFTPEDREKMKQKFDRKELELNKGIWEALKGSSINPIGRDRTFRRFWMFPSLPGLYVEDNEENVLSDFFQVADQVGSKASADDKNTSSDKENESFDNSNIPGVNNEAEPMDISNNKVINLDAPAEKIQRGNMISVHEQIAIRNKVSWSFFNTEDQLEKLINSLNPRGFREGPLKAVLQEQKALLLESIDKCPAELLCMSESESDSAKRKSDAVQYQSLKSRNKTTQGAVRNSSAEEFLELNLREMLLDFEERVCFGTLGSIKVTDRVSWREAIENGGYKPMCEELTWNGKTVNGNIPCDEDDDDEEVARQLVVKDLSHALLQLGQMVEPKYLVTPLGENEKGKKQKVKAASQSKSSSKDRKSHKAKRADADSDDSDGSDEETQEDSKPQPKTAFERWEENLGKATSLSQVFLHLSILDLSVAWSKSALHARCRICRRKGDGEKMLLCDGCDRGHHMYCLKPQVKKVPQGDWFCPDCRPKDVTRTPRKRRRSTFEDEVEEDIVELSSSEDDSDSDDEDDSDDESHNSSTEDDDSQPDTEDEATEEVTYKIKLLPKKKKQPASGRSTPTSVISKASNKGSKLQKSTEKNLDKSKSNSSSKKPQSSRLSSRSSRPSLEAEERPSSRSGRRSAEAVSSTERPTSRPSRRSLPDIQSTDRSAKSQRSSLENAIKRKLELNEDDSPVSKKVMLTSSRGNDKTTLMKECEDLANELAQRDEAWPFLKPVTRRDAPDYFDIVKNPMDFATMRNKINHFEYKNPLEILEDVRRIFSNCEQYNMPTAPEYQAAKKLSRFFEKRVKDAKLEKKIETTKSPLKRGSPPSAPKRSTRSR